MSHFERKPFVKRFMGRLNRYHGPINSFYGDFFKSLWLIPYNLSSLTKVIECRSIWEIDDHKTKIRPLFMLWTVPRWRKSVVPHYVVSQWLWSALAINSTLFQESSTNDIEIAIDSNLISVLNLYTSVSWWRYPSLKSLVARGRFYGTYISKAVICFFVC